MIGSGTGLGSWLLIRRFIRTQEEREARLTRIDLPRLASAILFVGIIAPVLLLAGLLWTPALFRLAITQLGRGFQAAGDRTESCESSAPVPLRPALIMRDRGRHP